MESKDSIVNSVIKQFCDRSNVGVAKYGTTLEQNNTDDFLQHLKEELMDATLYVEKLQHQGQAKRFPNGFTSWMETHYEVVAKIEERLAIRATGVAHKRQHLQGIGGLYELSEELTDKFELEFEGEEWEGNDFFDTIGRFLDTHL